MSSERGPTAERTARPGCSVRTWGPRVRPPAGEFASTWATQEPENQHFKCFLVILMGNRMRILLGKRKEIFFFLIYHKLCSESCVVTTQSSCSASRLQCMPCYSPPSWGGVSASSLTKLLSSKTPTDKNLSQAFILVKGDKHGVQC